MFGDTPFYKKLLSILPVLPVYFIISFVTICVTRYYIFNGHSMFTLYKICFGGIFYFFALMVVLTHLRSMFTNPGFVASGWEPMTKSNKASEFCRKCKNDRPVRAHHCKICQRCTLKMDHHCPWIANCVGFRNQKFFYQFLFYAALGDLIGFIILITRLQESEYTQKGTYNQPISEQKVFNVWEIIWMLWSQLMIVLSSTFAAAMFVSIGFLFAYQTKLILNNQTTIENKIFLDAEESPHYYNDKSHNFKIVMGETFFEWFFPVSTKTNLYNNGVSFENPKTLTPIEINSDRNTNYMHLEELELNDMNRSQESKLQSE
jgi:hypothetical protein